MPPIERIIEGGAAAVALYLLIWLVVHLVRSNREKDARAAERDKWIENLMTNHIDTNTTAIKGLSGNIGKMNICMDRMTVNLEHNTEMQKELREEIRRNGRQP